MRIKYLAILAGKIKQGDFVWIFRHVFKYLAIKLFYITNITLSGPIIGMFYVTLRCNLKCIMCNLPKIYQGNIRELNTDEMLKVIDGFAHIGTSAVIFTGGEPLLRQDIYILIKHAKKRKLYVCIYTNGFLLDDEKIELLLASGIDGINLPLDGLFADTHDKIRNVKGSYERVIYAINRISSLRKKNNKKVSLSVTCVICKYNIDEILGLIPFVSRLGVDYITFTPVQLQENHEMSLIMPDPKKTQRVISKLIELKRKTKLIDCSIEYLKLLNFYFAGKEHPVKCYAGYASCTVDCYGNIYPCTLGSPIVSNIKDTPLERCWKADSFSKVRKIIKTCGRCYRNCWKELSLIFDNSKI